LDLNDSTAKDNSGDLGGDVSVVFLPGVMRVGFASAVVLIALCGLSFAADLKYKDVDCGWHGINEQQCTGRGCVWLSGFPGPWCQLANSPYIPSRFDFGFDKMTDDEVIVFKYAVLTLVVLSLAILTARRSMFLNKDLILVSVLFVLAAITRYHAIDAPKEIVFDEFYFGQFANAYCTGVYVFDIHPPLAKITHYLFGTALGNKCTFDFHAKAPLDKYNEPAEYVHYRQVSAMFGTLSVPLAYLIGRKFQFSVETSIVLAALVFCDPLLLSETRLVLTDSQLFFYIILSIYCALQLWDSEPKSRARDLWTVATAVSGGAAFGVKFTALASLAWIAFATFIAAFNNKAPIGLIRCFVAALIAAAVFIAPFYFHIKWGTHSGEQDWNLDEEHQKLIIGNSNYDRKAVGPSFPKHLLYLLNRMLEQNRASLGAHPYASYWYQWIVGSGALLSYSEHKEEEDWHGHVFITSSVYICYTILGALFCFIPVALTLLRSRVSHALSSREIRFLKTGFLFLLGWVANLLPYALVARTTYSYHHLPAQFYGMLMVCLVLDDFPYLFFSLFYKGKQLEALLHRVRSVIAIIFMIGLFYTFWYYACFSYGYGLSNIEYSKRKWAVSGI
jgi:dolichyl-phosphate-mannose--protein O-mannosyl transferase